MQDLLQLREVHNEVVRVRKFHKDDDYRVMWKSIKGERRVVLDCAPGMLAELLNASSEFGFTGQFNVSPLILKLVITFANFTAFLTQHIFLTHLDTYTDNLGELSADNETFAVYITAARLHLNPDPLPVS